MIQKQKLLGLFAMLPLLTAALYAGPIGEAEAVGGLGVKELEEQKKAPEPTPVAKLILKQVAEPVAASPSTKSYKGFNEEQYDDTKTFRVVYLVFNEADNDVRNVEISVKSDVESIQTKLQGKLEPKHSTVSVMIKALEADSIKARITGYQAA